MGIVDEDVEYLGGALQLLWYMDVYQYHILEEVTIFKGDPQDDTLKDAQVRIIWVRV